MKKPIVPLADGARDLKIREKTGSKSNQIVFQTL
jgi:hypothetical protein